MRKSIGYVLIAVTLCTILGWVYAVMKAQQLVGSPFLWVLTPFFLFVGFYLVARLPEGTVDKATQRSIRRRLILVYLVFSGCISLAFLIVHVLDLTVPPPSFSVYVPVAILVAMVAYGPFYWYWVRRAGYAGRSNILIPLFFVLGIAFSPMAFIEIYNGYSGELEVVESGADLLQARSNFIKVRNINLRTPYQLEWTYHWLDHKRFGEEDDHAVEFWGLVPVATGRQDTLFTYWIDFRFFKKFDGDQPNDTLLALEKEFYQTCRDRLASFSADSVTFFDRSEQNAKKVLRYNNYPLAMESVVMKPVYQGLQDYRQSESLMYIILFVLVTLFFWGSAALNDA